MMSGVMNPVAYFNRNAKIDGKEVLTYRMYKENANDQKGNKENCR
jgi:hypothetical protein